MSAPKLRDETMTFYTLADALEAYESVIVDLEHGSDDYLEYIRDEASKALGITARNQGD